MNIIQAIDFGSTFTKVSAIDVDSLEIIGTAKSFTTIETDVRDGLNNAIKELAAQCGKVSFTKRIASSSAAGGLRMISSGLVPELTAKASKMAASSAGAKVLKCYSYELTEFDKEEIFKLYPDIVLLCGGIDGGNKEVILHNAKALADIDGRFHVIVAGNKSASYEAAEILKQGGKLPLITENVMPEFNKLNIEPAKNEIRNLFIKNIVVAKGLSQVREELDDDIIPTPLAAFEAAELLSRGGAGEAGIGSLMAYDVGGATTDVYSMAAGDPSKPNVTPKGFREPYAKRSVEGDIGMRYSISSLVDEAGSADIADRLGILEQDVLDWVKACSLNPETVPQNGSIHKQIDEELAACAVDISADRHCGYIEAYYTPFGQSYMQTGKDLTPVKYVIGSGGSVINSQNPAAILKRSCFNPAKMDILKPENPEFLIDKKNLFAAMGLIGRFYPKEAVKIMQREFSKI